MQAALLGKGFDLLDFLRDIAAVQNNAANFRIAAIRKLAVAVMPIIPASAAKLVAAIDAGADGTAIAQPTPIFPRLELEDSAE